MPKTLIADTGPIIHLTEVDALKVLNVLGPVMVPDAVYQEALCALGHGNWQAFVSKNVLDDQLTGQARFICTIAGLHKGESEAIVLANLTEDSIFLTDDAAARLYAVYQGLDVRGSLGLVLASVALGFVDGSEGFDILYKLRSSSLWMSARVFKEATEALKAITSGHSS